MPTSYNPNELVNAGTLNVMFREFAEIMVESGTPMPVWDEEAERYTNASVAAWMDNFADGLVYGVQIPRYDADPTVLATKTGANAGLVLEPSTLEVAGRNDYEGRKLFFCPRVNGGVDVDGTNYVTAIEGFDDRFDETQDTFVLTPVYYVKRSEVENEGVVIADLHEFTDTAREGFEPCIGAYKSDGTSREFILRACYMDSDGHMSSRSGEIPSANYPNHEGQMYFSHNCLNEFVATQANTDNGLTFFTFGDMTYLLDFMQLMLGAKAPKNFASGQRAYNMTGNIRKSETGVTHVAVSLTDANKFEVGMSVAVGTGARTAANIHSVVPHATVLSKTEREGDSFIDINLDVSEPFDVTTSHDIMNMSWINGCLNGVRGTYGSFTEASLVNEANKTAAHRWPFKFQNMEWMTGLGVVIQNLRAVYFQEDVEGTTRTITQLCAAPDVSACVLEYTEDAETGERTYTGFIHPQGYIPNPAYVDPETTPDEPETIPDPNDPEDLYGPGWETPSHGRWTWGLSWFIRDYKIVGDVAIPTADAAGTSTTGYMCKAYRSSGEKVEKEVVTFGQGLASPLVSVNEGVGQFRASQALDMNELHGYDGGRASCIGHSSRTPQQTNA